MRHDRRKDAIDRLRALVSAGGTGIKLNRKAMVLGDKKGDGRPAIGPHSITTNQFVRLVNGCESETPMQAMARFDAAMLEVTEGKWSADDYCRETVGSKGKRGRKPRATTVEPDWTAPVFEPEPEPEEEEPEEVSDSDTVEDDLAASKDATIARLEAEIRSLAGGDKPHPLADIMVDPSEVLREAMRYEAPPAMVAAVEAIRLGARSDDPGMIKSLLDLAGPAGSGKSMAACWIANKLGWALVKIDCSLLEDTGKGFFLSLGASGGSTTDAPSHFTRAIQEPRTVVLLDEVSRAPLTAQNGLLPIFDGYGTARVSLTNGDTMIVSRAPEVVAVMARNEGREYVGAGAIDAALLSRANKITLSPPRYTKARKILKATKCPTKTIDKLLYLYCSVYRAKLGYEGEILEVDRIPAEAISLRAITSVAASVAAGVDEQTAFRMGIYSHMKVATRNADPVLALAAKCGHTLDDSAWSHSDMIIADKTMDGGAV